MSNNILLCDMGGTHARFARFIEQGDYADFKKYKLNDYTSFDAIVRDYLKDTGLSFSKARFAVARRPDKGVIRYKRFSGDPDYEINFPQLEKLFQWENCLYLNDLEAAAHGATILTEDQKKLIIPATHSPVTDNAVVISVGTGVGHAGIHGKEIFQTAGGHFLPVTVTEQQREVEAFIRAKKDASLSLIMEDFVSSRGLRMITEFISGESNDDHDNDVFFDQLKSHPEAITLFFEFLGLHVHTLVSVFGFYGGVYLAGGVIDYLIHYGLTDWDSFDRFFKPPMVSSVNDRLAGCGVHYVLHDELPLLGLTTLD